MESSSPGLRDEAFPRPNKPSPPTPTQSTLRRFVQEQNQAGVTMLPLSLDQKRDEQEPWSLAQLPAAFSSIAAHSDDRPPMRNDGGCSGSDEAKEKATEDEHPFPLFALPVSEEQGRDLKHGVPKFHKSTFDDKTFVGEAFNSTQAEANGGVEKAHSDNDKSCYGGTKPGAEFIRNDSESLSSAFQTETAPVDNKQESDVELVDHDESKAKRWEFGEETERCDHKHSHAEFIQGTGEREISTQSDRHGLQKSSTQEIGAIMLDASVDDNDKGESDTNLDDDESDEGSYYSEYDLEEGSDSSDDDESEEGSDSSNGESMIKFQALCESLRENDPCITRVVDLFHDHWDGLGRPLGNALLCNTRVTHLYLDGSIAYNADSNFDLHEIEDVLSFLRCSTSLRSFHCDIADSWVGATEVTTSWIDAVTESLHIEEFSLGSSREFCPRGIRQQRHLSAWNWPCVGTKTMNAISMLFGT
jgi:hypothetical protein